jgi:hypothetical protein
MEGREILRSFLGNEYVVLDSHSAYSSSIDTRFDCVSHARLQYVFGPEMQRGDRFMHRYSNSMTEAMNQIL